MRRCLLGSGGYWLFYYWLALLQFILAGSLIRWGLRGGKMLNEVVDYLRKRGAKILHLEILDDERGPFVAVSTSEGGPVSAVDGDTALQKIEQFTAERLTK